MTWLTSALTSQSSHAVGRSQSLARQMETALESCVRRRQAVHVVHPGRTIRRPARTVGWNGREVSVERGRVAERYAATRRVNCWPLLWAMSFREAHDGQGAEEMPAPGSGNSRGQSGHVLRSGSQLPERQPGRLGRRHSRRPLVCERGEQAVTAASGGNLRGAAM